MQALENPEFVSVEDYLAGELQSPVKHEYLGGILYAMSGGRNRHNKIAMNLSAILWNQLRGKPCQPYNSDTKVRIQLPNQVRFYYPDVSVVCRPNPLEDSYQDEPVVVAEVLSESTRRTDQGEKKDAYLSVPSLSVYLLVEQDQTKVVAFRRAEGGFVREVYSQGNLPLPEIGCHLHLAELYEGT